MAPSCAAGSGASSMTQLRDLVRREPKRGLAFPPWLERLAALGIVATDPHVVQRQRCVNIAAFAVLGTSLLHLMVISIHDFRGMLPVNVYNVLYILGALLVPFLHRLGEHAGAIALILLVLVLQTLIVWSFGLDSDLHVYFTLGGAVLFFFGARNWRLSLFFSGLFVVALLIVLNYAPVEGLVRAEDKSFREVLSYQAMVSSAAIIAALLFYALAARERAEVELEDQYERSEVLIGTVMPRAIAARLTSGREDRIADRIEMLSVLFADLVGFTAAAHDLAPEQVVEFLDRLVCSFDALADVHGVEKIKTIGDNYMVAAGFDGRAAESAVAIGRFSRAMLEVADREALLGGRKLRIRIGIHCGTATAGIIGVTRFSYDVWGDAVNFASRMESHGLPGRIQVSEAFRELTRDEFEFEERGTTDLKGIGAARTFFLIGERSSCRRRAGEGARIEPRPSQS
jgi:adenylate cyclase